MFVLFIFHHILNRRWWAGIFKGKYTAARTLQMVIDLLTLAAMLGLMVNGMILSSKVFAFLQIRGHMAFARRLRMAASYWGFLLMAAHLGLHWGMLLGMIRKAGKTRLSGKPVSPLPTAAGALEHYESIGDASRYEGVDATSSANVVVPGNAAKIAAWIQQEVGGDLFSIVAVEPYPSGG